MSRVEPTIESSIKDVWTSAHRITRSARKMINKGLRPLGLSSSEGNVLLHLFVQGGNTSQEQLAQQLDVGKAAVSRAVDSLSAKGYVTKEKRTDDRRAYRLSLTENASLIGPAVEAVYNRVYLVARKGVSEDKFKEALGLLFRVAQNFEKE